MSGASPRFALLGPLQMAKDGVLVPLGAPKQRAVLAVLVINRNRVVSVDALIDAVWGEQPVPAAKTSIHSYVSHLRRLLGSATRDATSQLTSVAPGYRLNVADTDCDVGRFVAEKNAGIRAAAAGHFEQACSLLIAALAEWRGPFLDDLREFGFVEAYAAATAEDKVVAQSALAEAEIACGRLGSAIPRLQLLTTEHPFREQLWTQLITAYYVAERQSDALDAYLRLKANLAQHLGVDPGPTLQHVYGQILRQEPLDVRGTVQTTATRRVATLAGPTDLADSPLALAELRADDGQRYRLHSATRIGRRADNDIVLDDDDVSRYHAVITDARGTFVVSDLRSTNGVYVGGRRITRVATLTDGDHVRIGGYTFTFVMCRR